MVGRFPKKWSVVSRIRNSESTLAYPSDPGFHVSNSKDRLASTLGGGAWIREALLWQVVLVQQAVSLLKSKFLDEARLKSREWGYSRTCETSASRVRLEQTPQPEYKTSR